MHTCMSAEVFALYDIDSSENFKICLYFCVLEINSHIGHLYFFLVFKCYLSRGSISQISAQSHNHKRICHAQLN